MASVNVKRAAPQSASPRQQSFPLLVSGCVAVVSWRKRDATGDTWLQTTRSLRRDGPPSHSPAPAWEVKFAMGLLRHGTVPPPVSHSRREVRFAAAATLSE